LKYCVMTANEKIVFAKSYIAHETTGAEKRRKRSGCVSTE